MHNEEKPQAVEGAVSRRGLLEKGAMLAAVSAVPLSAGAAAQDADREVERRQGHDAQAHELVPVRAGPPRGLEHDDGQVQQEPEQVQGRVDGLAGQPVRGPRQHAGAGRRHRRRRHDPDPRPGRAPGQAGRRARADQLDRQEGRRSPERLAQLHPQGRQPLRHQHRRGRLRPALQQGAAREGGHQAAGDRPRAVAGADRQADEQAQPVRPLLAQHHGRAVLVLVHSPGLGQRLRRQVGHRQEAQPDGSEDHQDAHGLEGVLRPDGAAGLERCGLGAPVLERADRAGADRVGRRQHHQDDGPEGLPEPAQRQRRGRAASRSPVCTRSRSSRPRRTWTAPSRS